MLSWFKRKRFQPSVQQLACELSELCDEYDHRFADVERPEEHPPLLFVLTLSFFAVFSLVVAGVTGSGILSAVWLFISIVSFPFCIWPFCDGLFSNTAAGQQQMLMEQRQQLLARIERKRSSLLAAMDQS